MSQPMMYNHGMIDEHANTIKAHSVALTTMLDDLKSELRALEASWEGSGSSSYLELKAKWDQAAAGLNATLNTVGHVVSTGNNDMSGTDSSVASSFH